MKKVKIVKRNKVSKKGECAKNSAKNNTKLATLNLSGNSLALLFGIAEKGAALLSEVLKTTVALEKKINELQIHQLALDNRRGELKDLKEDSARMILWRLQQKGLVMKNVGKYELTDIGENFVESFSNQENTTPWDGKWRIVMFDIPEQQRRDRNWLRWHLQFLDYRQLQRSVFVGREPLEKDFYEELLERNLKECVRLLTVGEIDDDSIFGNFE